MYRFKNYIAFFLLVLFVRVLAPAATILALHDHEHTRDVHKKDDIGLKLDTQHTHCATDQLFNANFALPSFLTVKPAIVTFTSTYLVHNFCIWKFTFPTNIDLRGPPKA